MCMTVFGLEAVTSWSLCKDSCNTGHLAWYGFVSIGATGLSRSRLWNYTLEAFEVKERKCHNAHCVAWLIYLKQFKITVQLITINFFIHAFSTYVALPDVRLNIFSPKSSNLKGKEDTYCLMNCTASSYFIPHSMRAKATKTGALRGKEIQQTSSRRQWENQRREREKRRLNAKVHMVP